jgi:hypothetical protein
MRALLIDAHLPRNIIATVPPKLMWQATQGASDFLVRRTFPNRNWSLITSTAALIELDRLKLTASLFWLTYTCWNDAFRMDLTAAFM